MTMTESSTTPSPRAADETESRLQTNLPLMVVDRTAPTASSRATVYRMLSRYLALAGLIAASIAAGGVIGLYRQPPALQWFMRTFGLEPGGGSSTPIALPVSKPTGTDAAARQTAASVDAQIVVALGRLLPVGEVVTVTTASGVRDARIDSLNVAEGDRVEAGQIIAVLDSEPRFKAAVEAAERTVALREAALAQTITAVRASRAETEAAIARAEAGRLRAEQDFERSRALVASGYVTKATHDQRVGALHEAEREIERLKATLSRYRAEDIDQQPDVLVARRNKEAARSELSRARKDLDQAYVRAPFAATILEVHARAGEKPGEKGVASIGDTDAMIVKIEVYQSQIGRVGVGDHVELSAPALSKRLTAQVSRIGLLVKKQSVIDSDPAANTDARVVEVIAALDAASSRIAARFTNLQIEARIETRGRP
jgi:HlyD family secretion protein